MLHLHSSLHVLGAVVPLETHSASSFWRQWLWSCLLWWNHHSFLKENVQAQVSREKQQKSPGIARGSFFCIYCVTKSAFPILRRGKVRACVTRGSVMTTTVNNRELLFSNYDLSLGIFSSRRTYALMSAADFETVQLGRGVPRPDPADQTRSVWWWPHVCKLKIIFPIFSSLNINSSYLHMYDSEFYEYTMATRNHLLQRRLRISVCFYIRNEGFVNFNLRESSSS